MTATITAPTVSFKMTASSANFQSLFNGLTTNINSHITQADFPHPDFANATDAVSNASGSYAVLVRRNASTGGANLGSLGVVPIAASASTLVNIAALTGHSGNLLAASVNGVSQFAVGPTGTLSALGQLIAGSGARAITIADGHLDLTQLSAAGTANTIPVANGTAWSAQPFSEGLIAAQSVHMTKMADYAVTTNASAATVTMLAGGGGVDGNGLPVLAVAQQNVALANAVAATQPTGTNSQYVLISQAAATFAGVATGGTVGVSPGLPTLPSGNVAKALVLWRGATANPSNIIAASDILDLRQPGGGGGTGGGGGGGGIATSAAVITRGDLRGLYANSVPDTMLLNGSSALGDPLTVLARSATDAPLGAAFRGIIVGNVIGNIAAAGSAISLTNPAGATPIVVGVGGSMRQQLGGVTLTATNSPSSAGTYYIVADTNTAGVSTYTLQVSTTPPAAGQITLATAYWSGTAWDLTTIAYNLPTINGTNYRPTKLRLPAVSPGTVASSAGAWVLVGSPVTVNVPTGGMMAKINFRGTVTQPASISSLIDIGIAYASGGTVIATNVQSTFIAAGGMAASTGPISYSDYLEVTGLSQGPATFQMVYLTNAANVVLTGLAANGEITLPA